MLPVLKIMGAAMKKLFLTLVVFGTFGLISAASADDAEKEPTLLADGETLQCEFEAAYPSIPPGMGWYPLTATKTGSAFTKSGKSWISYGLSRDGLRNGEAELELCASTPSENTKCDGDTVEFKIARWTYSSGKTLASLDFRFNYLERGIGYFNRDTIFSVQVKPRDLFDSGISFELPIPVGRSKMKRLKASCFVRKLDKNNN